MRLFRRSFPDNLLDDPNFPALTRSKIASLLQGCKSTGQEESEWLFDSRAEAAVLYYHSPYPEVRSVTIPFDDPTVPAETLRAYVLGMIFMGASTTVTRFLRLENQQYTSRRMYFRYC